MQVRKDLLPQLCYLFDYIAHFEYIAHCLLFSKVCDEKCVDTLIEDLLCGTNHFSSFQVSLSLPLESLIVICLGMGLFERMLPGVH